MSALLLCWSCEARVKDYTLAVKAEYPHDTGAYTQGLFFHDGTLCESTGQWGQSSYRTVDLKTGKVQQKVDFARKYFGEGSVVFKNQLYILTWTNKIAFVYDPSTLKYIKSYTYPREGWGLTTDGKHLIASDGSNKLYFMDEKMQVQRTVNVTLEGRAMRYLNELEYIDGKIWANVYTTDFILIINPADGKVEGRIDCKGLLPSKLRTADTDVLNGIAQDPATGKIYLTGKNWPRLYEVQLKERK